MPFSQPSLVDCVTCKEQVSINAAACPHCGEPDPSLVPNTGKTAARLDWERSPEGLRARAAQQRKRRNRARAALMRQVAGALLVVAAISLVLQFFSAGYAVVTTGLVLAALGLWWAQRRLLREPRDTETKPHRRLAFWRRRKADAEIEADT